MGNDSGNLKFNAELYVGGLLNNIHDIKSAISNVLVWLWTICVDPEKSKIYKAFVAILDIITERTASEWLASRNPRFTAHKIASDLQDILVNFALVASNSTLSTAIKEGKAITGTPMLTTLQDCRNIAARLGGDIRTGNDEPYEKGGHVWYMLNQGKPGGQAPPG